MTTENTAGKVIVTVGGRDVELVQETLGVNMDSSEQQVLDAVQGVISENLRADDNEYAFTVRKVVSENLILCFPKPVAG
jgi:hypothetical protein